MDEDYDRLVAALPRLTPDQRARLAERLRVLQALAPGHAPADPAGGPQDEADEVLGIIAAVAQRASGERASPLALRRSPQFPAFRAKARLLAEFAAKSAPDRARRRALLDLGFEILYRDLRRAGFSVTSRTLMQCAHQVPASLDRGFPGYAVAGLLGMIVGVPRSLARRLDEEEAD